MVLKNVVLKNVVLKNEGSVPDPYYLENSASNDHQPVKSLTFFMMDIALECPYEYVRYLYLATWEYGIPT